jgi:hypothetical protein
MSDLVEFLKARLGEDEQAARRAGETFRQIGETGVIVATEGDRAEECASANWTGAAEHIVRHDPARVLREVEMKRRIIDEHHPVDPCDAHDAELESIPCDTLLLLALPYADHEEFQDEWCV